MTTKLFTRNFIFLILGQVSSLLGNFTLKFALSMYVLEETGSASIFAGLLSMALLPTILLSPFGGILADRANRRTIMIVLDTLSGVSVLISSTVLFLGYDLFVIGLLLIILSILGAFESPTVQACIPQMLSGDTIIKGNAMVQQAASVASLVTPFLGSLFYTAFGIRTVLYAAAICFFITAFWECFIQLEFRRSVPKIKIRAIVKEDFSLSIHFLHRERPEILKLLLLSALVSLFVAGTAVIGFPYLVRSVLGLSAEYYGAAESAMGIAAVLGSICVAVLAEKIQIHHLSALFLSFGLCLIPSGIVFLLPISTYMQYSVLLLMFCICQFGCSVFSTYTISMIQDRTPEHLMGKVMSCVFTLSMCVQPLGQILYGVLFDLFSETAYWVLLPSGFLVCTAGIISNRFFQKLEKQNSAPLTRSPIQSQEQDGI